MKYRFKKNVKINGNFFLLWQGLTASSLGTHLFSMLGIIWLVEVVNSASLVGSLMLALGISIAIFTPLGGVLADRLSRRNILVIVDLCSGLTVLGLASLFFLSDTLPSLMIGLFTTQVILGACAGFFMPSVFALLPDILSDRGLATGNAVINITTSITQVLGRGFSGLLFVWLGAPVLLLVIGVCFLLSALTELFIQLPTTNKDIHLEPVVTSNIKAESAPGIVNSVITDVKEGVNHILTNKGMTKAFLLQAGLIWCLSTLIVNTPFLVQYHFVQDSAWYGYLLASLSSGLILGSICAGRQFNQLTGLSSRSHLLRLALVSAPLLCIGLAFTNSVYTSLPLFFLQGVFQSIASIIIITQVQMAAPGQLRGRMVSVITMISTLVFAGSSFIIGLLIDAVDKDVVLVQWLLGIVGCLLIYPLLIAKDLFFFIGHSHGSGSHNKYSHGPRDIASE